jgi:hypothetical protein
VDWFSENFQLTKHVRHIEVWVPVWADKSPEHQKTRFMDSPAHVVPIPSFTSLHGPAPAHSNSTAQEIYNQTNDLSRHLAENNDDQYPCFTYPFSNGSTSATLSEIFSHIACFFSQAQIFTLEGGHCKKSNMIRQFPTALFPAPHRRLEVLPNIRTFAMRGAWNIIREYDHWTVIQSALPGLQEWHCSYAKPRAEAYTTINSILSHFPTKLRHMNISLDGFYCKDGVDGTGVLGSTPQSNSVSHHLCERLGRVAPQLESLSFTGRICECFFRTAIEVARARKEVSQLRAVDIIVKSCCRLVLVNKPQAEDHHDESIIDTTEDVALDFNSLNTNPSTSNSSTTTSIATPLNPIQQSNHQHFHPSEPALTGLTNMTFIHTFERLILSSILSIDPSSFPVLSHIRIRFIDLDSACPLLNPYFIYDGTRGGRCAGVWNEDILDALWRVRPGAVGWEELADGIENDKSTAGDGKSGDDEGLSLGGLLGAEGVRRKPRAIRGSAYRVLADKR